MITRNKFIDYYGSRLASKREDESFAPRQGGRVHRNRFSAEAEALQECRSVLLSLPIGSNLAKERFKKDESRMTLLRRCLLVILILIMIIANLTGCRKFSPWEVYRAEYRNPNTPASPLALWLGDGDYRILPFPISTVARIAQLSTTF